MAYKQSIEEKNCGKDKILASMNSKSGDDEQDELEADITTAMTSTNSYDVTRP